MDEPAAGLHEAEIPDFAAVVLAVRDQFDAGVLLIDHNVPLIMEVCDRIQVLDQGRTLAEGTPGRDPGATSRSRPPTSERPTVAEDVVLGISELEVRYGTVPAVRQLGFDVAPRRDRRADRAERRRQVDDAARDHGPRPASRAARSARRPLAARPRAGDDRAARRRARARGPPHLRRADRRREPPARARGAPLARGARRRPRLGPQPLPGASPSSAAVMPARSPAGSSSSSRSHARCSRGPSVLLLDEPSLGLAPDRRRDGVRDARPDPRPRRHDPARRAARACSPSRSPTART